MRRHGWGGDPPATDEEAVRRILDATRACLDRDGVDTGIADVARELGVTRQTVYRYFRTADDLLSATMMDASAAFLTRLERHLTRHGSTAAEAVVEGLAFTIERLPEEPYMGLFLAPGRLSVFSQGVTSPTALALGRATVDRFPIEWGALGLDDVDLDGLVEFLLRILQSFIVDPGTPPRTGAELRAYLMRWAAPALTGTGVRP